jgi:uncharacterized membrane protein YgdD (TMEM256/DUF423 family)
MASFFLMSGALAGLLSVAFGAFGAHALRARLDEYLLGVFQTGIQYQFYHSLALLVIGLLALQFPADNLLRASGALCLLGIFVFSGSLYLLVLIGLRWWGAVAPIGGLAFIAAWACLAGFAWKLSAV